MSNDKPRLRFSTIEMHIAKIVLDDIIILQFFLQKTNRREMFVYTLNLVEFSL